MKVKKKLFEIFTVGLRSYACVKKIEKTGMQLTEIMLMKDGYKACAQYYSRNLSIFLRAVFGKKKQSAKLVKTSEIDPAIRAKIKGMLAQPKLAPAVSAASKKSLFEGTHLPHE